jgi:hypothetical protein
MFEFAFRKVGAGEAEQLPDLLPQLGYTILAPFMGPAAAAGFVEAR